MKTKQEKYFLTQLGWKYGEKEKIKCGYFRSPLSESASFIAAAKAKAFFLAIDDERLGIIETRAPGTSKPLLETKGKFEILFSDILSVDINEDEIFIFTDVGKVFAMEFNLENSFFPEQKFLLSALIKQFDLSTDLGALAAMKRSKKLKAWRPFVIGLVFSIVIVTLKFLGII